MNCLSRHRLLQSTLHHLPKRCNTNNSHMWSKKYPLGPLDNVDQRGNQLFRLLDRLDRHVTMRVWQEACKVVDELNQDTTLERRELPVVFVKEMTYIPIHKIEYPPRNIPPVIPAGTLMWWSIDDVFELVINPGYGVFATTENVAEYGNIKVSVSSASDRGVAEPGDDDQCDPALQALLQESALVSRGPVSKEQVLDYLRSELNLFVSSDKSVLLGETISKPGEYLVPLKISGDVIENLRVVVSGS